MWVQGVYGPASLSGDVAGTFRLWLPAGYTPPLSAAASAAEVAAAVGALVGDASAVSVTARNWVWPGVGAGRRWDVTFAPALGGVELMYADGSRLTGTDAVAAVYPVVTARLTAAGAAPSGSFALTYGGGATPYFDVATLDADTVAAALEQLPALARVRVEATEPLEGLAAPVWATAGSATLAVGASVTDLAGVQLDTPAGRYTVTAHSRATGTATLNASYAGATGWLPATAARVLPGVHLTVTLLAYTGSALESFGVLPGPDFAGMAAAAGASAALGAVPHSLVLGTAPAVQLVTTVAPDASRNASSQYALAYGAAVTACIGLTAPPAALAAAINTALAGEDEELRVAVSAAASLASPFVTVYTITFYGRSRLPTPAPLELVGDAGCAAPAINGTVGVGYPRPSPASAATGARYTALAPFTAYALRLSAHTHAHGYGAPTALARLQAPEYAFVPGVPGALELEDARVGDELNVYWQAPRYDGGEPPLRYVLEVDGTGGFDGTGDFARLEYAVVPEVQVVRLTTGGPGGGGDGTFVLAWGGARTVPLPWNVTADTLSLELQRITNTFAAATAAIDVNRRVHAGGYEWAVTFHGVRGDVALLTPDDTGLLAAGAAVTVTELVAGAADIVPGGYTAEVQSVYVEVMGVWDGASTLVVSYEGADAAALPLVTAAGALDSPANLAAAMRAALQALPTIDTVHVAAAHRIDAWRGTVGVEWIVTFAHVRQEAGAQGAGNLGALRINAAASNLSRLAPGSPITTNYNLAASVTQLVAGTPPLRVVLPHLTAGVRRFGRVAAYNSRGLGGFSATAVGVPTAQPGSPTGAYAAVASASSVGVGWAAPASDGGLSVTGYLVEWYAGPVVRAVHTITVSAGDGVAGVQTVRLTADGAGVSGAFQVGVMGVSTAGMSAGSAVAAAVGNTGVVAWAEEVAVDVSADGMKRALERTGAVGTVTVTRRPSWRRLPGVYTVAAGGTALVADARSAGGDFTTSAAAAALAAAGAGTPLRVSTPAPLLDALTTDAFRLATGSVSSTGFSLATPADPTVSAAFAGVDGLTVYVWLPGNGWEWDVAFERSTRTGVMPALAVRAGTAFGGAPGASLRTVVAGRRRRWAARLRWAWAVR